MAINASVGARVGEYLLVKKLGEGGMAEVWLARHSVSAQLRAIKFLNQQFQGIPEVEARFQTEGESQLVHPNIVRIYHVGQEQGSSYLVMDFIDGRDLEKILDSRRGPLTVPESVDIGMQVLAGLGFAHANGIVHRDIKPSNVLVDSENQAYLMDFGIAKALRGTRSVTQVNSRLGTPDYMSPEQIRNPRDVDRRSDIYSFGCMFYELLTGWPPFDRGAGYETEHDIKTAHCTELPIPPIDRRNNLPIDLNGITLHCLAKAKEDRPQSCEEIYAVLDAYRASMSRTQQPARSSTMPDTPKSATVPGMPPRRDTEVLSPNQAPFQTPNQTPPPFSSQPGFASPAGFSNQGRTPTVTDDALYAQRQPAGQSFAQPSASSTVPAYVPPVTSAGTSKNGSAKGSQKLVMAVGGLLLVTALAGGGWFVFHKEPAKVDTSPSSEGTATGGNTANTGSQQPGTSTTGTKAGPVPGKNPVNGNGNQKLPPQQNGQVQVPANQNPPKQQNQANPSKITPPPSVPSAGTLVWSGDAATVGNHVTIVRSMATALQGGQVSGAMFPAAPIRVTVRPAGAATVSLPNAKTNYNSLDLFLPNPGQQTIYLDWTALPNSQ